MLPFGNFYCFRRVNRWPLFVSSCVKRYDRFTGEKQLICRNKRIAVVSLMTSLNPPPTIPPAVSKQLAILVGDSDANGGSKRVPQESAEAISEALRLFVKEAHRRASIEVSVFCFVAHQQKISRNHLARSLHHMRFLGSIIESPSSSNISNYHMKKSVPLWQIYWMALSVGNEKQILVEQTIFIVTGRMRR